MDQPFWARRLIANGIGARVPFRALTAHKLRDALAPLLDVATKERAAQIATRLRAEDGTATAVHHLTPGR